ncbi:MAG: hypothetical protein IPG64_19330 [Haliea sp.]|nr:hypothetical protein [Haliea sp.]
MTHQYPARLPDRQAIPGATATQSLSPAGYGATSGINDSVNAMCENPPSRPQRRARR